MAASDTEIIEFVLQGDVERYKELVDRYQQRAWQVAYSFVRNSEDAKEISQIGFVKAYEHLKDFRGKARFSTWLYRIIVNECKDFFRRQRHQPVLLAPALDPEETDDSVLFEVIDPAGTPRDVMEAHELAVELSRAIGTLSFRQRTAFVLHHLHDMPLADVARIMGCRLGTVKVHIFRAVAQLRVVLSPFMERGG